MVRRPSYAAQVVGSLIVAALIVVIVVITVTMAIGPGLDAKEQRDGRGNQEEVDDEGGSGKD
jgi:hypothetical protein